MKRDDSLLLKEHLLRQKKDLERAFRVVKYIDFPFVLKDSPVEVEEGYIVSDRETCDVFASFIFKNVSVRPIKKLKILLSLYLNQNIPYCNIEFTYSHDELTFGLIKKKGKELKLKEANKKAFIQTSESFGSCVFIPIPESYFSKLEVTLLSVDYLNGETEMLDTVVTGNNKRYNELDDISKLVYSRVNIYQAAEEKHPTVVIPQFGVKVWLCCCGNKNPIDSAKCEKCGREKEYQEKTLSESAIAETRSEMINDPREITLHNKSKFAQNKYLENDADIQKKIADYESAMRNVALAEERRQRNLWVLVPKMLLWFFGIWILIFAIIIVFAIGTSGGDVSLGSIISTIINFLF